MLVCKNATVQAEYDVVQTVNPPLILMLHAAASWLEQKYGKVLTITDLLRNDESSPHHYNRAGDTRIAHPDRGDLSVSPSPEEAMAVAELFNDAFRYDDDHRVCVPEFFEPGNKIPFNHPIPNYTTRSHLHWQTIDLCEWSQL